MDSKSLTVVIAIACLVIGALVCWLAMRGRTSAAAPQTAHPGAQAELAQAKERARQLEADHQTAVANHEKLKLQVAQLRESLDLAQKEQTKLAEKAALVSGLELRLRALQEQEKAGQPAAQAKAKAQNELADAKKRIRVLEEERQAAVTNDEKSKLQATQLREALELAQIEQAQLAQLAERAAQVPALEARLLAMHDQENADHAAAAQAKLAVQTELAEATARSLLVERDYQLAVASHEELKLQAAQWRQALDLAQKEQAQLPALQASNAATAESLKLASARLDELTHENAVLKHDAAAVAAYLEDQKQHPAAPATGPTQLPVLEKEVVALQTLAKTIQQEFQLLAELQRTFTLTSTTVQDFSDNPETEEDASVAAT